MGIVDRKVNLVRFSNPCVLPGDRSCLEVSSKADVRTATVTKFQRLVLALRHRDRQCRSNTGVFLQRLSVFNIVQTGLTANPEIAVQRRPHSRLEVVAEVTLERSNGSLRLRIRAGEN